MTDEDLKYINVIEVDHKKILPVKPLDATRLLIDTSSLDFLSVEKNAEGEIKSISFEGKQSICLGDKITVKIGLVESTYYTKMIIVDDKQNNVIIFSSLPNKTSTFLLPLVNMTKLQLRYDTYFENAFLHTDLKHICLLYRFTGTNLYKEFESFILKQNLFERHFNFDPCHVMYLFRIPETFRKDIEFFLDGKYSRFSVTLRDLISNFYGPESFVFQIVYKTRNLKEILEKELDVKLDDDMELASKPILELEVIELKHTF